MKVKHLNDIHSEQVSAGTKTYRQVLIGPEEAPNFAMRRFIIEPGGEMPRHTNTVEHEQFVLNGRARVGIGDDVFEVRKNDVVFIPVDMPHWYKALGDENFEFICVVPNKPDRVLLMEP
jgi:quercetin dioxygenase-like cupin family protein